MSESLQAAGGRTRVAMQAARPTPRAAFSVTCFSAPAVELDRVSKHFESAAGTEVPAIVLSLIHI